MENKVILPQHISNKIRNLSFIMSCIIVAYHCFSDGNYINSIDYDINSNLYILINELATIAMYYFFFTSGFLLFINLNKNTVKAKIKKRIVSLLLPYIFWQVAIYLSKIIVLRQSITMAEFINTVFLFRNWPPNGPLWYVYIIFLLSLFSSLFLKVFNNRKISIFFIPTLSFIVYLAYIFLPLNCSFFENSYLTNTLHYFSSYLIGSYMGYLLTNKRDTKEIFIILILTVIFDSMLGLIIAKEVLFSIVPLIMILIIDFKINMNKTLCGFSFLIYALHPIIKTIFLNIITNTLSNLSFSYTLVNIFAILAILAICIIISFLIKTFVNKIYPKALILITGGR